MSTPVPVSRQTDIVTQEFEDEVVIYDLQTNKAFVLNETCAFVWRNCDGNKEIAEISKELAQRQQQPINDDIVWLAIEQLKKNNLIENVEDLKSRFEGLKRREVVKKIGLTTMIALPMISVLVAPTAVNAASGVACVPNFGTCIFNNFTQSNCCPNSRCDQATAPPIVGICMNCFMTGLGIGPGGDVTACNSRPERNLCCDTITNTTSSGGVCFCP